MSEKTGGRPRQDGRHEPRTTIADPTDSAQAAAPAGKWLSHAAVLWALDEASDLPPELVAPLVAVARYADQNGRGAYMSADTLALHTRKSRRQARRDLDRLVALGFLLPGDPSLVKHIRADRRPDVYDLPMPRGDAGDPPYEGTPMTPRTETRGVMDDPPSGPRGVTGDRTGGHPGHHGGSPVTPEDLLNNPGTALSPAVALIADRLPMATSAEREKILDKLKPRARTSLIGYLRSIPREDFAAMLDDVRATPAAARSQRPLRCPRHMLDYSPGGECRGCAADRKAGAA